MIPVRLLVVLSLAACEPPVEPVEPPPAEEPPPPPIPTVPVQVSVAEAAEGVPRALETRGLITALVELGLTDLPGVVPTVGERPLSPGLADALRAEIAPWRLSLSVAAVDGLTVSADLCDAAGACHPLAGSGPAESPQIAAAAVLEGCAGVLGLPITEGVAAQWRAPLSGDSYAILLAGRGAAVVYGLKEPAPDALLGDSRRDPVDRAVLVDPGIAPSAWNLSRRDAERGLYDRARVPLPRARAARPWSVTLAAEEAALLDETARPRVAHLAWDELGRRAPRDPRWLLPRAAAALEAGEIQTATAILDTVPDTHQDDEPVVALRVGIADAADPNGARDALLERWQNAAATNPEPVRRRIALRVESRAYPEALALTEALSARGAGDEAARLALPLALGSGDRPAARRAAQTLGLPDVVASLDVADRLEANPADFDAVPPTMPVLKGRALLKAQRPAEALAAADAVLAKKPYDLEALALRVDALAAAGRTDDVAKAVERLRFVDPATEKVRSQL